MIQGKTFSNAIWNVVNGSSGAVVAVIVPPFLTAQLAPEAYGAWALALQIGTYVSLFGFGIQIAVARFIAHHEAREEIEERDGIVATAFWALIASAIVAFLTLAYLSWNIALIVPDLSAELLRDTKVAILCVSLALAASLPASVFAAVFIGRQESRTAAIIQGGGRLAIAAGLIVCSFAGSIPLLGAVYLVVNCFIILILWYRWRTRTRSPTVSLGLASRKYLSELWRFCLSITLWNLAMLMVNGLDLIIVGRFDYAATAFYAVCASLATLVVGTLSSLSNALIPAAAKIPDSERVNTLPPLLLRSSRLIAAAAILIATPLIFFSSPVLRLWLDATYAAEAGAFLPLLVLAAMIRNLMLPYVTIAIGIGRQRWMIWTPLIEGLIAISASILLAKSFGAAGVAVAKILSGTCGVALLLGQHALKDAMVTVSRWQIARASVIPSIISLSIILTAAVSLSSHARELNELVQMIIIIIVAVGCVWRINFDRWARRECKAHVSLMLSRMRIMKNR